MDEMFKKVTNNMVDATNSLSEKDREYLLNYDPCVNRGFAWDTGSEYSRIKIYCQPRQIVMDIVVLHFQFV